MDGENHLRKPTRYWTEPEHARFVMAYRAQGSRSPAKLSNVVGTRDPEQTRNHFRKYLKKLGSFEHSQLPGKQLLKIFLELPNMPTDPGQNPLVAVVRLENGDTATITFSKSPTVFLREDGTSTVVTSEGSPSSRHLPYSPSLVSKKSSFLTVDVQPSWLDVPFGGLSPTATCSSLSASEDSSYLDTGSYADYLGDNHDDLTISTVLAAEGDLGPDALDTHIFAGLEQNSELG